MRYRREEFLLHAARVLGFFQRLMLRVDVRSGDDPAGYFSRLVVLRNSAHQEPSIGAVGMAPQANLDLGRALKAGGHSPLRADRCEIVGMHEFKQALGAD